MTAIGIGLAVPVLLEVILRLFNAVPPDRPIRELFENRGPVFERAGDIYRTSEKSKEFILADSFMAQKKNNTTRIFIVGGSTAMGFPLDDLFGPKKHISIALQTLDRSRRFEIIRAAGLAFASFEVVDVIEEIIQYGPDAIIIMCAHNEFLETRFPEAHDNAFTRMLFRVRTYRALTGLVRWINGDLGKDKREVHSVTADEIEVVGVDYGKNLERIVDLCRSRGVVPILVTMPSNLKDFRPFGPSSVPIPEMVEIDKKLKAGELDEAGSILLQWEKKYPEDAWIAYEQAWVWHKRGEAAAREAAENQGEERADKENFKSLADRYNQRAAQLWIKARRNDLWPIRAFAGINETIRQTAKDKDVEVADVEARFKQHFPPYGITDNSIFFDHCHPAPAGQPLLAKVIIKKLSDIGLAHLPKDWEQLIDKKWSEYESSISDKEWSESYIKISYETGINMGRVYPGASYADKALALNPGSKKAKWLIKELKPYTQNMYPLTGD